MTTTIAKCIVTSWAHVRSSAIHSPDNSVFVHGASANDAKSVEQLMANVDCSIDSTPAAAILPRPRV